MADIDFNAPILVTGGAGFVGGVVKRALLDAGRACVSVDIIDDPDTHPSLICRTLDIRDNKAMKALFEEFQFTSVFHFATEFMYDTVADRTRLWETNVTATETLRDLCRQKGVRHLAFTSSCAVWGQSFTEPVDEMVPTNPIEIYGNSKVAGEDILLADLEGAGQDMTVVVYRVPVVIDVTRRGSLVLLFDFIREGRKVWTVGGGKNHFQFLYATDLADAILKGERSLKGRVILHLGSDNVPTLAEAFEYVIARSGTGARLASLPKGLALAGLRFARWLRVSPIGLYQSRMIASDFVYDTTRAKKTLDWTPTLTNSEMLWLAYEDYIKSLNTAAADGGSPNTGRPKFGIIGLVKALS